MNIIKRLITTEESWKAIIFALGLSVIWTLAFTFVAIVTYLTPIFPYLFTYKLALPVFITALIHIIISFNNLIYTFVLNGLFGPSGILLSPFLGAPIIEELQFRGLPWLLRHHNSKYLKMGIAILTTLFFILCHAVPLGAMFSIGCVGIASCWMVHKTKKLWPSMIFHSLYNIFVTLLI